MEYILIKYICMVILGINTFHGDSSAATACGMHLINAKTVGVSVDFVRSGVNGIELSKLNSNELVNVFNYYEKLDEDLLRNGSKVSRGIAEGFDSYAYSRWVERFSSKDKKCLTSASIGYI